MGWGLGLNITYTGHMTLNIKLKCRCHKQTCRVGIWNQELASDAFAFLPAATNGGSLDAEASVSFRV